MSRAARWWIVFGTCNVVVALALVWTTRVVIELERSELRARAESDYQESLRLAMWRMDSWLALLLAREAARPRVDYLSFYERDGAEALEPESDYIKLHFEIDVNGQVSSPRAPGSAFKGVSGLTEKDRAAGRKTLDRYRHHLDLASVQAAVSQADTLVDTKLAGFEPSVTRETRNPSPLLKTQNEFDARVACTVPRPPGADGAGRQVVVWLDGPDPAQEPALVFLRRTESVDDDLFQGFVLDWPRLRDRLLFEVRDLFPAARLERVTSAVPIDPLGRGLANLPVMLTAAAPDPVQTPWITAGGTALAVAWLAAIVAAVAVGATLRKSIDLGERRRRFVSAVTHELRTPLTTFQMYSEMLADGLVSTEEQRKQYLQTLKEESQRLSSMVSNVLTHARIEQRRAPPRFESTSLKGLLARLIPPLERRVESTSVALEVEIEGSGDGPLSVDVEAIGQILGNLVDNAAKYASRAAPPKILLGAAMRNGSLILTVRDHGPGIPREQAKAIFAPFERGGRDPADPVPGVGLGLALARGLARDMGGELTLENPRDGGARFRLELPAPAVG